MPNMSYCQFENTSNDLRDCLNTIDEASTMQDLDLSCDEQHALDDMYILCQRFVAQVDHLRSVDEHPEDEEEYDE